MAHSRLRGSILRAISFAVYLLLCVLFQASFALAQHPGHVAGGVHPVSAARVAPPHISIPPTPHLAMSRPQVLAHTGGFHLQQHPIHFFPPRVFFHSPFFGFRGGLGINYVWWPSCGPYSGWGFEWGWGFGCNPLPYYGYGFENSVTLQPYYLYEQEAHDLVWLSMKDGSVYYVTDYWFVNGQLHFISVEDGGTKSFERVIGLSELDVQRTVDVNTRRGFRVVMRDAPLDKYLHDHPDLIPPLLAPEQNNH
jgi:hypothetical protein